MPLSAPPGRSPRARMTGFAGHGVALALLAGFALWSTFPLILELNTSIPGTGAGDNVTFLWNFWWMRHAGDTGGGFLRTSHLFAPFGTPLALHTHAALPAALGAILPVPIAAAHNLVLLLGLTMNGVAAYALAFWHTRAAMPSLVAGLLFAASAYVQIHLLGHFNLIHAWVLPSSALALLAFDRRPTAVRALLLAVAAAAAAYTDYYYAVYCAFLGAIWLLYRSLDVRLHRRGPFRRAARLFTALLALEAIVLLWIVLSGGSELELGAVRISARNLRNPLFAFWILLGAAALLWRPFSVRIGLKSSRAHPLGRHVGLALAASAILMAPLAYALATVVLGGEYVSQPVNWVSSPPGVDLATLVLGHPRHVVLGDATRRVYSRFGIDSVEQTAWLGLIALALVAARWAALKRMADARFWMMVSLVSFTLSLGPFLRVAGLDTALLLPHAVLRYVPVLSNARMPGRMIVLTQLGVAVLVAMALAQDRRGSRGALLAAVLAIETMPAPVPLYRLPAADAVDAHLRSAGTAGAVVELPTGIRDGFGETGAFDHRALVRQIGHEQPLVGGFVARLSPRTREAYVSSSFLSALMAVSAGTRASLPADAGAQAAALGIRYLVVNRDAVPHGAALSRGDVERAGFRFVASAGDRELYASASTTTNVR